MFLPIDQLLSFDNRLARDKMTAEYLFPQFIYIFMKIMHDLMIKRQAMQILCAK